MSRSLNGNEQPTFRARGRRPGALALAIAVLALLLAAPSYAAAAKLANGDLVVSDKRVPATPDGPGAIFLVSPTSGAQSVLSNNGSFVEPEDVAIASDGTLLIADKGENGQPAPTLNGLVIRFNPVTGAQTVVSSGGSMFNPTAIALAPNGVAFIADRGPTSGPPNNADGQVVSVDPKTGAQKVIASGGQLNEPRGIAVGPDGTIFVADVSDSQIVKVDPNTGQQIPIHTGAPLTGLGKLTLDPTGKLLAASSGATGSIFSVDPSTGTPTVLASNTTLAGAEGITRSIDGSIFTVRRGAGPVVRTSGGASTIVSNAGQFKETTGLDQAETCGPKYAGYAAFVGTAGADKMTGTPSPDVFIGGSGKDKIKGLGGKDVICGGPGKDKLIGGKGNDTLIGQGGQDVCNGGPGKNKLKKC